MLPSRPRRSAALLGILTLVAAACSPTTAEPSTSTAGSDEATGATAVVQVVATTSILGDVVGQLVGDDGEVTVLMGPGVDPHAYRPSARDAALLREADLVVANGLQLEESLVSLLEAAAEEGARVFELAPLVDPLPYEGPDDHGHDDDDGHGHDDDVDHGHDDDDGHGHDDDDHLHDDDDDHGHDDDDDHGHDDDDHAHGPDDPHVWFDPVRMATGVELLAAELADVAPSIGADEWTARGAAYADDLRALDVELAELFSAIPPGDRLLVTNHDALGYLAARYDLTVVGTVIPGASTQAESDPRRFSELVETVERLGVTTVFAENTDSARLAEQLASEVVGRGDVQIEVVRIATDALGEPGTPSDNYLGLLRETATTIAAALSG